MPLSIRSFEYKDIKKYNEDTHYRGKKKCDFGTSSKCHKKIRLINNISDQLHSSYEIISELLTKMSNMDIDGIEDFF